MPISYTIFSLPQKNQITVLVCMTLLLSGCDSPLGQLTRGSIQLEPVSRLINLEVSSLGIPMYPSFDKTVFNYAVPCMNNSTVEITIDSYPLQTISINEVKVEDPSKEFNHLVLDSSKDIKLTVEEMGTSIDYMIFCLPEDLAAIEIVQKTDKVYDGFFVISPRYKIDGSSVSYLLIVDNNGVPRVRRRVDAIVTNFRIEPNGMYSYVRRTGRNEFGKWDNEFVLLDNEFNEIHTLETKELNQTDNHESFVTVEGTVILSSYNSTHRDLSAYGYSTVELTRDSIIQELTLDGELLFQWNSWDDIKIENCLNHRFPDDYAHLNSISIASDGNMIASLRGCSQVVKINRQTSEIMWRFGAFDSDFEIVGDPYLEFCGQHSAFESSQGNIILFDNGGYCNGDRELIFDNFSRMVEYKLDETSNQAIFIRDYSLYDSYVHYTNSGGSVFELENGNIVINWAKTPVTSLTEIDKEGQIALEMTVKWNDELVRTYRAYKVPEVP